MTRFLEDWRATLAATAVGTAAVVLSAVLTAVWL